MAISEMHFPKDSEYLGPEEGILSHDERWQLVQRIVGSRGFQRSTQLRAILQYISRFAILHAGETLREHDIALDVLERRPDFDPAYDNIVRVQASHLRRRLEQYFAEEGVSEPVILTLPKGSYVPQFHAASLTSPTDVRPVNPVLLDSPEFIRGDHPSGFSQHTRRFAVVLAVCVLAVMGVLLAIRAMRARTSTAFKPAVATNLILRPLIQHGGTITVVLPDISLMEIQTFLKLDVKIPEYTSSDFPQNLLGKLKDPELRRALIYVGQKRSTSVGEANIATDILQELQRSGVRGLVRYARDLHVRDFGEGNIILIGSPRSNPWVSLFLNRTNFNYFEDSEGHYFLNVHPRQGEPAKYFSNQPSGESREEVSYVDVALVPNLTNSGFVLLISGADVQANEAAANFLLHGELPPSIKAALSHQDLKGFELFLKGKHLIGEADHMFEIVSCRFSYE